MTKFVAITECCTMIFIPPPKKHNNLETCATFSMKKWGTLGCLKIVTSRF